jgi:phage holin
MDILPLIIENRLILIPALIIIGWVCKHIQIIPDKFIPLILLALGIIFSLLMEWKFTVSAVIQGVLPAGAAVLGHQIPKQLKKDE